MSPYTKTPFPSWKVQVSSILAKKGMSWQAQVLSRMPERDTYWLWSMGIDAPSFVAHLLDEPAPRSRKSTAIDAAKRRVGIGPRRSSRRSRRSRRKSR